MSNHTPGPWSVIHLDAPYQQTSMICEMTEPTPICHTICSDPYTGDRRANAALVASSPDLLDALEWLREMAGYAQSHLEPEWRRRNGMDFQSALSQADTALAKARGE